MPCLHLYTNPRPNHNRYVHHECERRVRVYTPKQRNTAGYRRKKKLTYIFKMLFLSAISIMLNMSGPQKSLHVSITINHTKPNISQKTIFK